MAGVTTGLARVLIVDDKAEIRSLLATRVRLDPSFEVVGEATNGAEAIARIRELDPQVMILDLQMPVMSGEEVIPIVRTLAPALRVLVYSAYAGTPEKLAASELPDSEVGKGSGLGLLMEELHRLVSEPVPDLVRVELGRFRTQEALRASRAWARLNPRVREAAVDRGGMADFLALVGVFLALTDALQRDGSACLELGFTTRLEAGRAARRALAAICGPEGVQLEPLRGRLLRGLP